ncbi:phosphonate ABC transporter, permease protein PhnE [Candidatus Bipolaricaulota bacterium]
MRKPKKSKFARSRPIRDRVSAIKPRFLAFMVDWMLWGYVAYAVMYFLQRYWWRYIDFYNHLVLPSWGWPLVVIGTFQMALLTHAFTHSPGMATFHIKLVNDRLESPSFGQRLLRFLQMNLALIAQPLVFLLPSRPPERLLHDSPRTGFVIPLAVLKDLVPVAKPRPLYKTYRGIFLAGLVVMTFWLGLHIAQIDVSKLVSGWEYMAKIFSEILDIRLNYLFEDVNTGGQLFSIAYFMAETIFMALFSTLMGVLVAFPLSFLAARNIMGHSPLGWAIYSFMRFFFNAVRSIESLLFAIVFAIWVGFGNPFAGSLALFIHTIAALGKLFSEQVEAVDPGPLEAITASGARRWQVVIYGVIPQVMPSYLAFSLYRWDINIRMATVIALVGGGGIGTLIKYWKDAVGRFPDAWGQVGGVILVIAAVIWLMDYISGRVRERIE